MWAGDEWQFRVRNTHIYRVIVLSEGKNYKSDTRHFLKHSWFAMIALVCWVFLRNLMNKIQVFCDRIWKQKYFSFSYIYISRYLQKPTKLLFYAIYNTTYNSFTARVQFILIKIIVRKTTEKIGQDHIRRDLHPVCSRIYYKYSIYIYICLPTIMGRREKILKLRRRHGDVLIINSHRVFKRRKK